MLSTFSLSVAALAILSPIVSAGHIEKSRMHRVRGQGLHEADYDAAPSLNKRFGGTATYYAVGLGACGKYNSPGDFIVALNTAQYGGGYPGPNCFKHITITARGKSVGATIMDECPTCGYGDLDLSEGLFKQFANTDEGVFQMTWTFSDGSGGGSSGGSSNNDDDNSWQSKSSVSAKSVASVAAKAEESRASEAAAESWASRASVSDKSVASEASEAAKASASDASVASVSQFSVSSVAAASAAAAATTSALPTSTFVTETSALPTETGAADSSAASTSDTSSSAAAAVNGNNLGLLVQVLKQFGGVGAVGLSA